MSGRFRKVGPMKRLLSSFFIVATSANRRVCTVLSLAVDRLESLSDSLAWAESVLIAKDVKVIVKIIKENFTLSAKKAIMFSKKKTCNHFSDIFVEFHVQS